MSTVSSESAEQVVRLSLEGAEVVVKVVGSSAKNVLALICAIMKDKKQTKGKTRLTNMLKTGKELKIFSVRKEDLKKFTSEAKRYGVLYTSLINRKDKNLDGMIDIMVKAEDAGKINRIVERFKISTVDTAKIKTEIQREKEERNSQVSNLNPNIAKTEKSPPLEHFSKILDKSEGVAKSEVKKSVRQELKEIKEKMKQDSEKSNERKEIGKNPNKKTKVKKSKSKSR